MQILIDHNIEGFAPLLLGVLAKEGWVELLQLQLFLRYLIPLVDLRTHHVGGEAGHSLVHSRGACSAKRSQGQ